MIFEVSVEGLLELVPQSMRGKFGISREVSNNRRKSNGRLPNGSSYSKAGASRGRRMVLRMLYRFKTVSGHDSISSKLRFATNNWTCCCAYSIAMACEAWCKQVYYYVAG